MPPILAELGRSLDHWQSLYIISITVAVISAAMIVVFTFHRKHHSFLRGSNYVYLVFSVLAVVSTIAITTKTRSLDAEKDRQLTENTKRTDERIKLSDEKIKNSEREIEDAKTEAARAYRTAELAKRDSARARADSAAFANEGEKSRTERAKYEARVLELEQDKAPRFISPMQFKITAATLAKFKGETVWIYPIPSGGPEAGNYANTISALFTFAGLVPKFGIVISGFGQGLEMVVPNSAPMSPTAKGIMSAFHEAKIPLTVRPEHGGRDQLESGQQFRIYVGSK